jgi:hypothetical protein
MAAVGDRVHVPSRKIGEAPREGVVTGLTGSLLRVRWSTGEETMILPSVGSIEVIGKTPSRTTKKVAKVACEGDEGQQSPPSEGEAHGQESRNSHCEADEVQQGPGGEGDVHRQEAQQVAAERLGRST